MRRLGLGVVMVLVVAAGSVGASAGWRALSIRAERMPAASAWPILLQQTNGNLALANERGEMQPLTSDADGRGTVYLYPTPAPDGRRVAMVAVRHGATTAGSALEVIDLAGQRTVLYDQDNSTPFYLSWAPDSRKIAFLAGTTAGMTLHAADVDGASDAKQIAPGQPSYFAWSPNSERLLLHIGGGAPGGSLQLYEWGADQPQALAAAPASFQTPGWLPDGQQAFVVVQRGTAGTLATIDAGGSITRELAQVERNTIFVPAPNAQQLAYLSFSPEAAGQLHVLNTESADDQVVSASSVVTMFWSPSGETLAFLSVVGSGDLQSIAFGTQQTPPQLQWNVLDVRDGSVRQLVAFQPSREFLNLLPFFDQYAQSHRLWDQTGSRLLYADRGGVFSLDVQSGVTQRIGDGVLGLWMEQ